MATVEPDSIYFWKQIDMNFRLVVQLVSETGYDVDPEDLSWALEEPLEEAQDGV